MRTALKRTVILLLALLCAASCMPFASFAAEGNITSINDLNTDASELDSHAGETQYSSLEVNYRESYFIASEDVFDEEGYYLWYPRIKRLSEDEYILFYQNGRWGPDIFCCRSTDGKNWSEPEYVFKSHSTLMGKYTRAYATLDAILLENGDILVSACFRAIERNGQGSPSRFLMTEKGLVTSISKDRGKTWSEPEVIYHGRCWEPSFLQLPSGLIHLYFTHSAPYDEKYKTKMGSNVSSGVALLTSSDNGDNWTPLVLKSPYVAKRITQRATDVYNGIQLMTDQMPVGVLLNNGKTIAMVVESDRKGDLGLALCLIRSHDFFERELAETEEGPVDRTDDIEAGSGPYIAQFPSGEVAITYFHSLQTKLIMADETATEIYSNRAFDPFPQVKTGMWGDLFIEDSHTIICSTGDVIAETGVVNNLKSRGIGISRLELNHRINAKTMTPVVDGVSSDWQYNTDALFVGSASQAQVALRLAHDEEYVYVLIERLDNDVFEKHDTTTFSITTAGNEDYIRIEAGINGLNEVTKVGKNISTPDPSLVKSSVKLYGTADNSDDTDEGYIAEIAIPRSFFGESEDYSVQLKISNYDTDGRYADPDIFNGTKQFVTDTWPVVRLVSDVAKAPETEAPETSAPAVDKTDDVTEPADGSGSPVLVFSIAGVVAVAAVIAVAVLVVKKKK